MANTNLRPSDKFLLQRGDVSYVAYAQDLLDFQRDDISDILNGVESELETEIQDRIDGDKTLSDSLNSYRDYIRLGVDALFPSEFQETLQYNALIVENSLYNNLFNPCESNIDPSLTGQDRIDAETECYYSAVKSIYSGFATVLQRGFGFLNSSSYSNFKTAHTLLADETSVPDNNINWSVVKPDDFLMVSEFDAITGKPSDTNFALYKVVKNLNKDFIQDGSLTQVDGYHMLQLSWEGGKDDGAYFPTQSYSIRVMSDFRTELDGDYLSKTGDTVLGNLEFINSSIILRGSSTAGSALVFNEPVNQTIHKPNEDLVVRVGSGTGVTFHNDGKVSGVVTPESTELTSVVNVGYVKSEVSTINSSIDQVASDLNVVDQRIDAIARILDQFNFLHVENSTSNDIDSWTIETINKLSDGDIDFFDDTLATSGTPQRIIFSSTGTDNSIVVLSGASEDDVFEFVCTDGASQSFIYKITAITTISDGFQVDAIPIYKFGEPILQIGKQYKMKYYGAAQGITLEEANNKFFDRNTGGQITGPLTLHSTEVTPFMVTNPDSITKLEVFKDDGLKLSSDTTDTVIELSVNESNTYQVKLRYDGVYVNSSDNGPLSGFNVYVTNTSTPQFTVNTSKVDVHSKKITNVATSTGVDITEAVNVEYFENKLPDRIVAGQGIALNTSVDNIVTVSTTSTPPAIRNAVDVKDTINDGELLVWSNLENRFVGSNISNQMKGSNLMATSEEEADVGGMWTDGNNFFIKVS